MDTGLYDRDILSWSEHQALLLRRIAAGERVNDQVDWANVIEEVQSVGRSDLHAVQSLLTMAILHSLKAEAWPASRDVEQWRAEARLFRAQAADRFTESMRQRIDMARLYRTALQGLPSALDGIAPLPTGPVSPASLDDLLAAS